MKKIIFVFSLLCLLTSAAFSQRAWNDRIIDFNFAGQLNASNNLLGINDIARETIVIDFTQIADDMKQSGKGFNESISADFSAGFMLDIPKGLVFGANAGLQFYESLTIGKELFYFLGYGNKVNENINITADGYADIFAFAQADIGWNAGGLKVVISPAVYTAIAHVTTENSSIVFKNTADGKFAYELQGNFLVYTPVDMGVELVNDIMAGNYETLLDTGKNILTGLKQSAGLDIQAGFDYALNNDISVNALLRIPVIPSTMHYKSSFNVKSEWETTLQGVAQGTFSAPDFTMNSTAGEEIKYTINRPLKLNIGGDFHAWNNIMNYYGNIGICLEHPFARNLDEMSIYFDYLFGLRVGVFNILNLSVSTECTDKIYKQKVTAGINLKLAEVNVGVATASSDFAKSFSGCGASAFVDVHVGL